MSNQKVTILIPNYNTEELTKLCLRLIRKYTDFNLAKVIVIDNGSKDNSLSYLKTLSWIKLIERKTLSTETGSLSHSRALDMALKEVETPFVLSIHTDTLVHHQDWLPFLLKQIEIHPNIAGVGSWKLEKKSFAEKCLKFFEFILQKPYYLLTNKKHPGLEGANQQNYYLRSHCALYRVDLIKKYQMSFSDENETAGKIMHQKLVSLGYKMVFIPTDVLLKYMNHINHGTTVLNPELSRRKRSVKKGLYRIGKSFSKVNAEAILQNKQLDF